eukprot:379780-Amphidinium_carterae.1
MTVIIIGRTVVDPLRTRSVIAVVCDSLAVSLNGKLLQRCLRTVLLATEKAFAKDAVEKIESVFKAHILLGINMAFGKEAKKPNPTTLAQEPDEHTNINY